MDLDLNIIVKVEKINIHQCQVCSNIYLSVKDLEQHLARHDPDNIDITNEAVLKHMKSAHVVLDTIKAFKCQVCPEGFPSLTEYSLHKLEHIQQAVIKSRITKKDNTDSFKKTFKCTECDLSFFAKSTLLQHSIVHEPFRNICECGIGFYVKADLKSHKKLVHPICYKSEFDENESTDGEGGKSQQNKNQPKTVQIKRGKTYTKKRGAQQKLRAKPAIKIELKEKSTIKKSDKEGDEQSPLLKNKNGYACPICKKTIRDKGNMKTHLRIHTGERPYGCDKCGKRFTQSGALKVHLALHNGIKKFKCHHCDKMFLLKGALVLHERTHTKEKPYKCAYCEKAFSDPSAFARHTRTHTGLKPYQCPSCPMKFSDPSGLISHKLRHENKKDIKCDVCGKMFYNKHCLRLHMVSHTKTKDFECQDCGKKFGLKGNLSEHRKLKHPVLHMVRTHLKINCNKCSKPFTALSELKKHKLAGCITCYICHEVFSRLNDLSYHLRNVHLLDEIFECKDCGKMYKNNKELNRHCRKNHNNEKIVECHDCSERFASKSILRNHIKYKHTECVYCDKCHRKFYGENYLRKHIRNGCEKIACGICDKEFYGMRSMKKHLVVHIGIMKYECDICGKKFSRKNSVKSHLKLMHGGGWIH